MNFEQRFYSGQTFLPKPLIEIERNSNTLIIATTWGAPALGQIAIDIVKEQLGSAREETEVTRVTKFIEGLSDEGNRLRSAALLANDHIFLKENAKAYEGAVEIALISIQNRSLSWAQLGAPHVLLRNEQGYQPICYTPDWSWQLKQRSPMVSKALGLERNCYLNCGNCRVEKSDQLFLISRSNLPSPIYSLQESSLESVSKVLIDQDQQAPFWIGHLQF
jgi:hypothetical protein